MTISEILDKHSDLDYDKIILDYEGEIDEFEDRWEMDEILMDEEAKGKLDKNGNLIITVK